MAAGDTEMTVPANTTLTARTIAEQTGWKRLMPQGICQNTDVLERVTEYSYDMGNMGFIRYFADRTGMVLDPKHPEIIRRQELGLLTTPPAPLVLHQQLAVMTDEEYLTTDLLVYVESDNSSLSGKVIPREQRNLRRHRIFRGKLQDCWELYTQQGKKPVQPNGQFCLF